MIHKYMMSSSQEQGCVCVCVCRWHTCASLRIRCSVSSFTALVVNTGEYELVINFSCIVKTKTIVRSKYWYLCIPSLLLIWREVFTQTAQKIVQKYEVTQSKKKNLKKFWMNLNFLHSRPVASLRFQVRDLSHPFWRLRSHLKCFLSVLVLCNTLASCQPPVSSDKSRRRPLQAALEKTPEEGKKE